MNWNEFEASTIGQEPDHYVPSHFFSQTCGAVAWPGKRPGVAMVLGGGYEGSAEGAAEEDSEGNSQGHTEGHDEGADADDEKSVRLGRV